MTQIVETSLLKRPHIKRTYTKDELTELARCAHPETGPHYFLSNYFYVQHPTKGRLLYQPYPYQVNMLKTMNDYRLSTLLCGRQLGKTITAAGYLLWYASFKFDVTVLCAAHKFSGASEIMSRIRFAYESLPDFLRPGIVEYNKQSISFDNGSRIIAQTTTPTTGRGLSISCVSTKNTIVTVKNKKTGEISQLTIGELIDLLTENSQYEILTTEGFKNFSGITRNWKTTFSLFLESSSIECTDDHLFYSIDCNKWIPYNDINIGELIQTQYGAEKCIDKYPLGEQFVSDIVNVEDTHSFIANGINVHNCLYLDEFAYVRPSIQKEFWSSIVPTLSTGGKAIITSTPQSDEDQFATIWHNANKIVDDFGNTIPGGVGVNGFKAFSALWNEHPDRDETWEREARANLTEEVFLREHECRFILDSETLISPLALSKLQGMEPIERLGQVRWYVRPTQGNIYLVALDPSLGTGGDPAAIQVYEAKTNRQVAEWTHNKTVIENQVKILQEITKYLTAITKNPNDVYYTVENNTIGEAILVAIRDIGEENISGIFLSEPIKMGQSRKFRKGFCTTNSSKLMACSKLKTLIESGKIQINSKKMISELKSYISSGSTYKAKIGETDDLVSATLCIIRMMELLKDYIPDITTTIDFKNENMMPLPFIMVMR